MSKGNSGLFKPIPRTARSTSTPVFYVGTNGKALPAKYKKWIGVNKREKLLGKVKDRRLRRNPHAAPRVE